MPEETGWTGYHPLTKPGEIRILTLLHGSGDEPIKCLLTHAPIGKETYQALSY